MKYSAILVALALTLAVSSSANEQIYRRDIITDPTERNTKASATPTKNQEESTSRKPKETESETGSKKSTNSVSGSSQKESSSKGKSESSAKETSTSSKPKTTVENTQGPIKNINDDSSALEFTPKVLLAVGLAAIITVL